MWPFSRENRDKTTKIAAETRDSIENQNIPVSTENFLAYFGIQSLNLPAVTIDSALAVPSVWAAVAFLSRTLASLPLNAYRDTKDGPKKLGGKLQAVVHDAPNPEQGSFKFRQWFWQQVFTGGRGLAWIERTSQGVDSLWPMDPTKTTIQRRGGKIFYQFSDATHTIKEYPAGDVIDVPFMLWHDGLRHYGPITMGSKAIQLALAMNDYGSNFFAGGGVPPLALTGPLPAGPDAMKRAQADIKRSVDAAKNANEAVFPIPPGYELKPVGIDPAKGQMIEARRFQVEEIARIYQLPKVFLQDLIGATFSNTEQQNLMLVQHLVGQWAEAFEDELNLKIFGRSSGGGKYIEHNLDGLLRGDFVTRMAGLAQGVQNGLITPNEGRALDNRPAMENGDVLYIQGATVPLGTSAVTTTPPAKTPAKPANDNNATNDGAAAA
ncbi:phage portal protein [Mesorhizobium sp. BR1-1-3]|uniref:phage portal protein n=1 Tax=Mesorhizobium sp. BR1-1-3 TaxID=2876651 RepID=UPI001CD0B986|nr:phage portal protein [Mesorhizobium sp. BR1-1-3]MBZ9888116.1 phage portal protein [Mesorhizobium sp. BR1-1-3]